MIPPPRMRVVKLLGTSDREETLALQFDSESVDDGILALEICGAATTAADNGAITMWFTDESEVKCERQRYMVTQESVTFKDLAEVTYWLSFALLDIQRPTRPQKHLATALVEAANQF